MFKKNKILAVIPARSGSKRLLNKNIMKLNNKALLSYTCEASSRSKYIDFSILTSDSDEYLNIIDNRKIIKQKRLKSLAKDNSTSVDVIIDSIQYLKTITSEDINYVILLQPTSPFRNEKHIDEAIEYLFHKQADAVVSVCKSEYNPTIINKLPENNSMSLFFKKYKKEEKNLTKNDFFRLNGAIYICKINSLLVEHSLFLDNNIYAYEMNQLDSLDIDTELDFMLAETIIKMKKG